MTRPLYYEAHVTIEPVLDRAGLKKLEQSCRAHKFKPAELLMRNGQAHRDDTFCTARHKDLENLRNRTLHFVKWLQGDGFTVYRYKIEAALIDSKIADEMGLL